MAFDHLLQDLGGIPIPTVYVADEGWAALQGGDVSTDTAGNMYAPARFARLATSLYSLASELRTTASNSGDLSVGAFTELAIDINVTARQGATSPTVIFVLERKGADDIYYPLWTNTVSLAVTQVSTSIGSGCSVNQSFGSTIRFGWSFTGTSTPGFTFSASLIAK